MKLVRATGGKLPDDTIVASISLFIAFWFTCMLVGQLFSFEEMLGVMLLHVEWLNQGGALIVLSCIVVLELAAIPALLFMRSSRLARIAGWCAAGIVLLVWVGILINSVSNDTLVASGLFGAIIAVPTGWWAVTFVGMLSTLYSIASCRLVQKK